MISMAIPLTARDQALRILDKNGVKSQLAERCCRSLATYSKSALYFFNILICISHLLALPFYPLVFIWRQNLEMQKNPEQSCWWKVCHIWTNGSIHSDWGQTERSQFAKFLSLPVRCSSMWNLIQTFFSSCLAVLTEVHLPPSRRPPSRSLFLPFSRCWLDKHSSRVGRQILCFFICLRQKRSSCLCYM